MSDQFTCPSCGATCKIIPLKTLESVSETFSGVSSPAPITSSRRGGFWASEAVRDAVIGIYSAGAIYTVCWWYEFPPVWAVLTGFVVGVGSHFVRIVLYAPPRAMNEVKPVSQVIKVEHWDEFNKHVLLDELDNRVTFEELRRVSRAVILEGASWSRPSLCKAAGLSQSKFHILTADFERLHYVHLGADNKRVLSPRAFAFLRKVVVSTAATN